MQWEIYTYGNGDFLRQVFAAIAMMFGSDNYLVALKLSALLGLMAVLLRAAFDRNVVESFRWFLAMLVFCWVALVPKTTVLITDRVNMADSAVVGHVPLGLAGTASLFSALGVHLTSMTETVFHLPHALRYQDSGLLSAHRMYDALSNMSLTDARTRANYAEFVATCVIFDGIGQRRFSWEQVLASTDLAQFFSSRVAANVAHFRYTHPSGTDQILPCRSGFADVLLQDIEQPDALDAIMRTGITALVSRWGDEATALRHFRADVQAAFHYLLGVGASVDDMVVQAALVNGLSTGLSRLAQETGATEFNATMVASMQSFQQGRHGTLITLAKDKLPLVHGVIESFLYAVFPLIVLLAIIAPAKTSLHYAKLLLWIQLWAPLFAILNFAVIRWDQAALASLGAGGLSAGNMSEIAAYVADASAAAMLIGSLLPLLAWFLVTGAGGWLAGMAAGILRGAPPRYGRNDSHGRTDSHGPEGRASSPPLLPPPPSALLQSSALPQPRSTTHAGTAPNAAVAASPPSWINGRWLAAREGGGPSSGDISPQQLRAEQAWAEQRLSETDALSAAAARELASLSRTSTSSTELPLPVAAAALPSSTTNLSREDEVSALLGRVRFGMMGHPEVKRLQQLLGMDAQYHTGNFLALTRAAVAHWQGLQQGHEQRQERAALAFVGAGAVTVDRGVPLRHTDVLDRADRLPLATEQGYAVAPNAHKRVDEGGALGRADLVKASGRHECVALLQAYGAPRTALWTRGEKLYPGIVLPQNTMIASFVEDARTGRWTYAGHAALFDAEQGGYTKNGLHVIQQFESGYPQHHQRVVHRGVIRDKAPGESKRLGDDASHYYVIQLH